LNKPLLRRTWMKSKAMSLGLGCAAFLSIVLSKQTRCEEHKEKKKKKEVVREAKTGVKLPLVLNSMGSPAQKLIGYSVQSSPYRLPFLNWSVPGVRSDLFVVAVYAEPNQHYIQRLESIHSSLPPPQTSSKVLPFTKSPEERREQQENDTYDLLLDPTLQCDRTLLIVTVAPTDAQLLQRTIIDTVGPRAEVRTGVSFLNTGSGHAFAAALNGLGDVPKKTYLSFTWKKGGALVMKHNDLLISFIQSALLSHTLFALYLGPYSVLHRDAKRELVALRSATSPTMPATTSPSTATSVVPCV